MAQSNNMSQTKTVAISSKRSIHNTKSIKYLKATKHRKARLPESELLAFHNGGCSLTQKNEVKVV